METKVWRPVGFPGLELEKDICLSGKVYQPRQMMPFFDLTVHTQGRAEGHAFFDKTYHRPGRVPLKGLVFLQNAGDVLEVDAAFTEPMSCWTVRLLVGQESALLASLGLSARPFRFEQVATTDDRLRRRLARDLCLTANSFETPASTLEREDKLLGLLAFAFKYRSGPQNLDRPLG